MASKWLTWLFPGGALLIVVMATEDVPHIQPHDYDADGDCVSDYPWKFGQSPEDVVMARECVVTLFTRRGWRTLLERAGFEHVKVEEDTFTPGGGCEPETHVFLSARKPLLCVTSERSGAVAAM